MAAICSDTTEIGTLSWFIIAEETRDASLGQLLNLIEQGNPSLARSHPALESFWPIYKSVYVQEGALLYHDRVNSESTGDNSMMREEASSPDRIGEQPTVVPEATSSRD